MATQLRNFLQQRDFHRGKFSLLAGDGTGVKFVYKGGLDPSTRMDIRSGSKFICAATIGHMVAEGILRWEDKANRHIDWWTKDPTDPRESVTLLNLLAQNAGVDGMEHGMGYFGPALEVWSPSSTTSVSAKAVYEKAFRKRMGVFYYNEGTFVVAQYMAMRAAGKASWAEVFDEHWAKPLGLSPGALPDKRNPRAGCDLVMNAWDMAVFLTAYTSGTFQCDRATLERPCSPVLNEPFPGIIMGEHYAVGHWVRALPNGVELHHSMGSKGAMPAVFSGKQWLYVHSGAGCGWECMEQSFGIVDHPEFLALLQEVLDAPAESTPAANKQRAGA